MARVFVITGPSGVGKGTLIRGLMERLPELELSVSATTRAARPGERDGVDYHFVSPEEFDRRVRAGEFVEHADYAGRRYGTLRAELDGRVRRGRAGRARDRGPGRPPGPRRDARGAAGLHRAALAARRCARACVGRGTDDPEEVERRLRVAEHELAAQAEFAHVVVNDHLEDALERLDDDRRAELRLTATELQPLQSQAQPRKACHQ